MAKITDREIVSICESEIDNASGYWNGELAEQRADALDRYLGEPMGDEVEGRSRFVTREVLDTVESIKPSMMRIFADSQNLVEFDAVGPEDEEAAEQESDRVNFAFWKENRGFYNLLTFVTDALLSKTGILKCWWDPTEHEEREEYKALSDFDLAQLLAEDGVEREVLEYEQTGPQEHHVVFKTVHKGGKLCIEPCPPEEFGVNRDARSPYAQDCQFVYHRTRKTISDLAEAGYDRELLDQIPTNDDVETEERQARRHLDDETDVLRTGTHRSMRSIWITECYMTIDRDDDGISELLKVTLAAGAGQTASGATLLDIEEVDAIPFFTAPPIVLTHKFFGLSIADLVMEIQEIKTTLLRQMLDNTYLSNNQRTAANENANLDDLMISRPGGVVRTAGSAPPSEALMPLSTPPLPPQAFELMDYLDEHRKQRTGVGEETAALDKTALSNVNTGVMAMAMDAARSKIELIARILAEIALRPLFLHIHELLQKHQVKSEVLKLRGQWVEVNPSEWRTRQNMTVNVGLGVTSRERKLMGLERTMELQEKAAAAGGLGTILSAENIYNVLHDYAEAWAQDPGRYWMNPADAPPQQEPEGPDPTMLAIESQHQIGMAQAEVAAQKNQIEAAKLESAERVKAAELRLREQELVADQRVAMLSADVKALESEAKAAEGQAKLTLEAELKVREQELREAEAAAKAEADAARHEVDIFKALIQSGTTLTTEQMKLAGAEEGGAQGYFDEAQANTSAAMQQMAASIAQAIENLHQTLDGMQAESRAPRVVERDEQGLIVSVGGRAVSRDDSGRVTTIG